MNDEQKQILIPIAQAQGAPYCILDEEGHCITCSDEAVQVTVQSVDLETGMACVSVQDAEEEVDISLVENVAPGDVLLVHGGVAMARAGETHV